MIKKLFWILFLMLCCRSVAAQTTTVIGTVTDKNSNPYYPGTVAAALQFPSGTTPSVNPSSGPFPTTTGGNFSIVLPSNSGITPPGTVWIITLCAQTVPIPNVSQTQVCFNSPPLVVNGSTLNISTVMNNLAPSLGPSSQGGSGSNILPTNNTFTGTNTFTNTTTFDAPAFFKSGAPWYDVQAFGAKGDCTTNDTAAILATANQALSDLAGSTGSGGVIYFSHSACPYIVGNITIPSGSFATGWLVFVFDQGLSVLAGDTITISGKFDAFIGRSGSFQGASGAQPAANNSTWLQSGIGSTPIVQLVPAPGVAPTVEQIYFEGINIVGNSVGPAVLLQDNGSGVGVTYVLARQSVFQNLGGGTLISALPTSSSAVVGYNFRAYDTQFITSAPGQAMQFTNFGQIVLRDDYGTGYIVVTNAGIPSDGDIEFDDVEIEGLHHDMLTLTGTYVNDVSLYHIKIPDPTGTVYMFNNQSTGGPLGPVNFEMNVTGNIASGLMNPAGSYPYFNCVGIGCPSYSVFNYLASVPSPTLNTQAIWWMDTSGNFRCTLNSGAACGAIFGAMTAASYQNAAWTASQPLCTDASTPPKAVTAGCAPGVNPLAPQPRLLVNGLSGNTLSTAPVGLCSGGATGATFDANYNITNTAYTWLSTDFGCLVARKPTANATDPFPEPNQTGFSVSPTLNWYTNAINNSPTFSVTLVTSGTFVCPTWCSGGSLTLLPGMSANITSPCNTACTGVTTWIVYTSNYPQTFGATQFDKAGNSAVSATPFFTASSSGGYRLTYYFGCSAASGSVSVTLAWIDGFTGISQSYASGTITCPNAGPGNAIPGINLASGGTITYAIVDGSAKAYQLNVLVEGPF
jgi:hypothetical protein